MSNEGRRQPTPGVYEHTPAPQQHVRVAERPELEALLKAAKSKVDAMSAEELEAMLAEQRQSWVRGEMQLDRKPTKTMEDILRKQAEVPRLRPASSPSPSTRKP